MPNTQNNTTPNSNNLFDIFKAQVESLSALNDVIVKAKLNKKVGKRISDASKVIIESSTAIYEIVNNLPVTSEKHGEKFKAYTQYIIGIGNEIGTIIETFSQIGTFDFVKGKFAIWRMRSLLRSVSNLIGSTLSITNLKARFASVIIRSLAETTQELSIMAKALMKIPLFGTGYRAVKRLYKILFGHKPGKPKLPGDKGLVDIFMEIQSKRRLKYMIKANWAVGLLIEPTKKLAGMCAILGLVSVLMPFALFSVWILKPIMRILVSGVFALVSRKLKLIFKGSIGLRLISGSLLIFVTSLVLIGLVTLLAVKPIGIAMLVIVSIISLFLLIGFIKPLLKRGYKAVRDIAIAVGMLALVAITMALLGQFITVNLEALLIVSLYMTVLIGAFFVLARITKTIRKSGKNILMIALCVTILALVATLMALVGQFIIGNTLAMLAVGLWIVAMVAGVVYVGKYRRKIENSIEALMVIAAFSLVMVLVVGLLTLIAASTNLLDLLATTGIMFLIIVGIGAIAVLAGNFEKEIATGTAALIMIAAICGIMSIVMLLLATAIFIANPLLILAGVGIMMMIILLVGAIAVGAGMLLMGPQAAVFALGIVALGMIATVCGMIAVVGILAAKAAKDIDSTGYKDPKELAAVLNLPFAALIRGDENGESVFTILKDLPGMVTMAKLVAKIGMLAMIMGETGLIANVLQHIASLNMPDPEAGYDSKGNPLGWKQMQADDFAKASMNTSVILGMTAAMFGDEEKEFTLGDGSRFKVHVVDLESINKIGLLTALKVKRLSKIVGYVGSMADVLQHIASLNMPDPEKGYDENGKPLGWKQMRGPDFAAAASNAGTILSFFADLFADKPVTRKILGQTVTIGMTNELAGLENISRKMRKRVSRLGEIVGVVGNMATTLQNIASLTIPDEIGEDGKVKTWKKMGDPEFATAASNAQLIITTLLSAVTSDEFAGQLEAMSKKSAKNFKTILEPMGQIGGMVDLVKAMSTGEYVKKWGDDPNNPGQRIPIEYGNFIELLDNKGQIQSNITSLFSIIIGSVAQFETDENYKDMRIGAKKSIKDISSIITGIKDPIDTMIEIYNNGLASLDVEQMEKKYNIVSANIKKIIDDVSGATTKKDVAVQIEKNLKQTTALFKSIDKTSVDKLRSASDLMRNIASLARSIHGDFDGLARVINEQLLTALEEFRDELKRINEEGIMVNGRHSDNIGDTLTDNKNPKVTNPDGKVEKGGQQQQQQQIDNKRKSLERAVNDILTLLQNVSDGSTPNSSTTLKIS